jgi:hypothetical protein
MKLIVIDLVFAVIKTGNNAPKCLNRLGSSSKGYCFGVQNGAE